MQNFEKMTQKWGKLDVFKVRILSFCEETGRTKTEISQKIEVSDTNFVGKNMTCAMGGDALAKFLNAYPEVSAEWLMRGVEPMFRSMGDEVPAETNVNNGVNNGHIGSEHNTVPADPAPAIVPAYCDVKTCELLKAKDETILSQKDTIEAQRITIDALRGGQK